MRLQPEEHVIVRTRAHPRALLSAAAVLVVTAGVLSYVLGVLARPDLIPALDRASGVLGLLAWVAAGVVVLLGTVRPVWRWLTRRIVLTSHRLVTHAGVGGAATQAMPLPAIVAVDRRLRGSGAGDLHLRFQDAYNQVYWRLTNVPEMERFEQVLAEATRAARAQAYVGGAVR